MAKYCVRCGAELSKTNYGNYFCPNCGMIPENQDIQNIKEKENKTNYIG